MKYSLVSYLLESNEPNRGAQAERIVLRAIIEEYLTGNTDLSKSKTKTIKNPHYDPKIKPEDRTEKQKAQYIDVDRTKVNIKNERLSPIVLKKIHKFIETDSYVSSKIEAENSRIRQQNKVANKKSVAKERSITVTGLPPAPWDSITKLKKTSRSGLERKRKTDWRLENIWVSSSESAEVDIHILWTDYSTVSFLGDMDSEHHAKGGHYKTNTDYEKDTLLWCFHVKQDGIDRETGREKKERRLFNVNNSPEQVFGTYSSTVDKQVEKAVANSIKTKVKNKSLYQDPSKIKGNRGRQNADMIMGRFLGTVLPYIANRLDGEHWRVRVNNDQTSAQCEKIDPPAGTDNEPQVTKYTKNRARVTVGSTSFDVAVEGNGQLAIYNYESDLGETPESGVQRNNDNLDIDGEYWRKELKDAKDTKYFYLVINGLMTATDEEEKSNVMATPKDPKNRWKRKKFATRISKTIGAGEQYWSSKKWADPLLSYREFVEGSFLPRYGIEMNSPRVTDKYIKDQRFEEWFESVGEKSLKSAGVMREQDTLGSMVLAFENWALLLMNANEMSMKEIKGMLAPHEVQWEKTRKYLEEMAKQHDWFVQNTTIGDVDMLGLVTGDEHWADNLPDFSSFTVESRKRKYSIVTKLL